VLVIATYLVASSVVIPNRSTLDIMAGLNWQNGFAGQQGSIADRLMRKGY